MWNVYQTRKKANLDFPPTLYQIVPYLVYIGANAAWISSPFSVLLDKHTLPLFAVLNAFIFGYRLHAKI